MRRRISITLRRQVRRRLERARQKTKDAELRIRLQIVLLYARGWGATRISESLGCAQATAVRVANRFLEDGEEGLIDQRCQNGTPKVDDDVLAALREMVDKRPEDYGWSRSTWSRELFAKELRRTTGIRVSTRTVGRMLDRLGARHGPARPIGRPEWSKLKKTRRVRRIMRQIENLPHGEVAFYQDEVDIHLNPKIGRDWMLPRQQRLIVTPGKNQKRYLYGALAVDGSDLVYMTSDRKNSDGFIAFLERLRASYPDAPRIHLILDNYVIHKSKKTQRYLARHGDLFVLHFLPPYSPEHNKIERLWRDLHGSVTRNHCHRTIDALMKAVGAWLLRERRRRRASASRARRPAA